MGSLRRRLGLVTGTRDSGIAIVAAMAVVMLAAVLVVVAVSVAMSAAGQTGQDRQRSSGVATAEAQVDTVTAQIQSAAPAALVSICGANSSSTRVGADTFALTTTVTFYNAAGQEIAGPDVACSGIATTPATTARIVVNAVSSKLAGQLPAQRTVVSELKLTPSYAIGLDKAIFSNSSLTMSNKTVLKSGSGKPDADIYTNSDFQCQNNEEFHGSIYAQGSITMTNTCTVYVDAWAKGNVSFTNPGVSVAGRVLSSTGNASLDKASVGQQARAKGTVTGNICSTAGKCFPGSTLDNPPQVNFPQFIWDSTAQSQWVAAGYTNIVVLPQSGTNYQCGNYGGSGPLNGKVDGGGLWLYDHASTLPANTILIVNCPNDKVTLQGIDISLNKNLLILSRAGVSFTNKTTISSVAGTGTASNPNLLYFVQPYAATTPASWTYTCQGDGISLDNQVTVANTVNTLLYSPCPIRKANLSAIVGQVYGGSTVSVDNQLDMTYYPLPVWGGIAATSNTVKSYSVDVMYKREGA